MTTIQILDVIKQYSLAEKLFIIEELFRDIRKETLKEVTAKENHKNVAHTLLADYQDDSELISFTVLDNEKFY
jgi:hypothetical protein